MVDDLTRFDECQVEREDARISREIYEAQRRITPNGTDIKPFEIFGMVDAKVGNTGRYAGIVSMHTASEFGSRSPALFAASLAALGGISRPVRCLDDVLRTEYVPGQTVGRTIQHIAEKLGERVDLHEYCRLQSTARFSSFGSAISPDRQTVAILELRAAEEAPADFLMEHAGQLAFYLATHHCKRRIDFDNLKISHRPDRTVTESVRDLSKTMFNEFAVGQMAWMTVKECVKL